MSDFVQEFTEAAEKVAKMMDLINKVTGKIQPIVINIGDAPMALILQPIVQQPAVEEVAEAPIEEVAEAPVEEIEEVAEKVAEEAPVIE